MIFKNLHMHTHTIICINIGWYKASTQSQTWTIWSRRHHGESLHGLDLKSWMYKKGSLKIKYKHLKMYKWTKYKKSNSHPNGKEAMTVRWSLNGLRCTQILRTSWHLYRRYYRMFLHSFLAVCYSFISQKIYIDGFELGMGDRGW